MCRTADYVDRAACTLCEPHKLSMKVTFFRPGWVGAHERDRRGRARGYIRTCFVCPCGPSVS